MSPTFTLTQPLAKSLERNGVIFTSDIFQHSNGVAELANLLLITNEFNSAFIKDQEIVLRYSALLHDIGKVTETFQYQLQQNIEIDSIKAKATHAQIGASFILMHLKQKNGINLNRLLNIVSNVYWHHGMQPWQHNPTKTNLQDIYNTISPNDLEVMLSVAKKLVGNDAISDKPFNHNSYNYILPNYFELTMANGETPAIDGLDKYNIVTRTILVLADRLYSTYEFTNKTIKQIHSEYLKSNKIHKETIKSNYPNFDKKRLSEQKKIANHKGTLFINAPTGNGKTMIGYLFANNNNKQTIWVNPNNVISTSVYNNLVDLIDKLGTKHKVSLLLGSEIIESNFKPNSENDVADITVTNIDNFFAPSTKNNENNSFFSLFSKDKTIIFDEYHGLIAESAYFSLFVYLMRIRTEILQDTNTMLLSATHSGLIDIIFYKKSKNKPYIELPSKNKHYKASHDKPYTINLRNVESVAEVDVKKGEIFFINTVSETQKAYLSSTKDDYNKDAIIYHSKFIKSDRTRIYNELVNTFGHKNKDKRKKKSVYASLVAQTSIDISFEKMYDTIFSIEATFQRMGRCNRWGEYDEARVDMINTTDTKLNKSNDGLVKLIYSTQLRQLWIDYVIKHINGKTVTKDDMYEHYNNFYNQKEVIQKNFEWIVKSSGKNNKGVLSTSLDYLKNVYPKRYPKKMDLEIEEIKKIKSGTNVIRQTGYTHFFFICEYDKSEKRDGKFIHTDKHLTYVNEVFSGELYGNDYKELKEPHNMSDIMIKAGKIIRNNKNGFYNNFDYSDAHISEYNGRLLDFWFKNGCYNTTPYILHKYVYNTKLGLINRESRGQ